LHGTFFSNLQKKRIPAAEVFRFCVATVALKAQEATPSSSLRAVLLQFRQVLLYLRQITRRLRDIHLHSDPVP
jgi:hypothetical protein